MNSNKHLPTRLQKKKADENLIGTLSKAKINH
jgi:hypothetical protein